jgi:hypothetical protein
VPGLGQERVLIVLATTRHDSSLLIEVTDFTERQKHPPSGRRERTKRAVVGAVNGESGNDDVAGVNVLRIRQSSA